MPGVNSDEIIGIKNELTNDGIIYIKYVVPVFKETLSVQTSFFDSWNSHYNTFDKFNYQINVIEKKIS